MVSDTKNILQLKDVTVSFGNFCALNNISLNFEAGKIYGIFGKNGAGKSLLMSLLAGAKTPSQGEILLHGKKVNFSCPYDAMSAGIGAVLQDDAFCDTASVAENLMIQDYAFFERRTPFYFLGTKKSAVSNC